MPRVPTPEEAARRAEQKSLHPLLRPRAAGGADDRQLSAAALAAQNLRLLLKKNFPLIRFRVRCDRDASNTSLVVMWASFPDAPGRNEVMALARSFVFGRFNGATENYDFEQDPDLLAFQAVFGSVGHARAEIRTPTPQENAAWEEARLNSQVPPVRRRARHRL